MIASFWGEKYYKKVLKESNIRVMELGIEKVNRSVDNLHAIEYLKSLGPKKERKRSILPFLSKKIPTEFSSPIFLYY